MLISRDRYPPGGWKFREPKMDWALGPGHTFKDAVSAIISKRVANPRFALPTDRGTVENELDAFTCALLKNNPVFCVEGAPPSFRSPPPAPRRPVGGNVGVAAGSGFLKNAGAGIRTWISWFGDGKPVEKTLAENRAAVCAKCVFNVKGNIMERFSAAAGKELLAILNSLHDLDLHTSLDSELNACSVCDCGLRAKVWCPLHVFAPHMSKETLGALPAHCWITTEKAAP